MHPDADDRLDRHERHAEQIALRFNGCVGGSIAVHLGLLGRRVDRLVNVGGAVVGSGLRRCHEAFIEERASDVVGHQHGVADGRGLDGARVCLYSGVSGIEHEEVVAALPGHLTEIHVGPGAGQVQFNIHRGFSKL